MVLFLAGCLCNIDYNITSSSGLKLISFTQYIIGVYLTLGGSVICEYVCMQILAKITSPIPALGSLNTGMTSGLAALVGRLLGNILVGFAGLIGGIHYLSIYLYSFYAVAIVLMLIIVLFMYSILDKLTFAQLIIEREVKQEDMFHPNQKTKVIFKGFDPNAEEDKYQSPSKSNRGQDPDN